MCVIRGLFVAPSPFTPLKRDSLDKTLFIKFFLFSGFLSNWQVSRSPSIRLWCLQSFKMIQRKFLFIVLWIKLSAFDMWMKTFNGKRWKQALMYKVEHSFALILLVQITELQTFFEPVYKWVSERSSKTVDPNPSYTEAAHFSQPASTRLLVTPGIGMITMTFLLHFLIFLLFCKRYSWKLWQLMARQNGNIKTFCH